jgi:hypothetical protein
MNWDLESSIWKSNGELYLFFRDMKDNDKSPLHERSSLKLWANLLMAHAESPLNNLLAEEKLIVLKDGFIRANETKIKELYGDEYKFLCIKHNVKKLDMDQLTKILYDAKEDDMLLESIINMSYPRYKKLLKDWEDKLEERRTFIKGIEYSREDWEMLEKLGGQTVKLWSEFFRIKKLAEDEQATVRGGEELSFLDDMLDD